MQSNGFCLSNAFIENPARSRLTVSSLQSDKLKAYLYDLPGFQVRVNWLTQFVEWLCSSESDRTDLRPQKSRKQETMFESLMSFFKDLSGDDEQSKLFAEGDHRVAAAALLAHLVSIDGVVDETEQAQLRKVLKARFDLSESETTELIEIAGERDKEAVDLYAFTSVLKKKLDEEGRIQIIEMMWEMVFADGEVHEFEDNLVWRVAELLGVSRRDRIRMRKVVQAQQENGQE